MKNRFFLLFLFVLPSVFFFCPASVFCDDLTVDAADLRLVPVYESGAAPGGVTADGVFSRIAGFHLYIRKKPDILSVLLTETTKDPEGIEDNYAYRDTEWNPVNGDEIRYLNGEPLNTNWARYSIIDSTPESHAELGEAFHLYIPRVMVYGYPWSRNGEVTIDRGVFINIRAFGSLHADYTNGFADNPFMFDFSIIRIPPPDPPPVLESVVPELTDAYSDKAVASFSDIAGLGGGKLVFSKGADDIIDRITESLESIPKAEFVDVVFCIDATGSMRDDIDKLRKEWLPRLVGTLSKYNDVRLGLLLYRDYEDSWRYQGLPVNMYQFTSDVDEFFKNLGAFTIRGTEGGDIPEPVYEALWGAMEFYPWNAAAEKKVILIGDAEPHPRPRGTGKYSKELVAQTSRQKNITIDTIVVPDDKLKRKR
jgi:hypothetical protein